MKKAIIVIVLIFANSAFADGEVDGSRMTALTRSKFKIQAALDAITDFSLVITEVTILLSGQVKVDLTSPNNRSCRAIIFDIEEDSTGGAKFQAVNPQRAVCN